MDDGRFLQPLEEFLRTWGFSEDRGTWVSQPEPGFERIVGVIRGLPLRMNRQTVGLGLRFEEVDQLLSLRGGAHATVAADAPPIQRCHVKSTVGELSPPWVRRFWGSGEPLEFEIFASAFLRFLGRILSREVFVQNWQRLVVEPDKVSAIREGSPAAQKAKVESSDFFGILGWREPPESVVAAVLCRLGRMDEAQMLLRAASRRASDTGHAVLSLRLETEATLLPKLVSTLQP